MCPERLAGAGPHSGAQRGESMELPPGEGCIWAWAVHKAVDEEAVALCQAQE